MKKVVAALIRKNGELLIAKRLPTEQMGALWEFPGGKVEPNEELTDCLHREIREELNVAIEIENHFITTVHQYPKGAIELICFLCKTKEHPINLTSHSEVRWIDPKTLFSFDLAPADIPAAEKYIQEFCA